ncbi:MAG: bifunctional DNA primase/polymerase, partial [Thermoplasmata archaeon]|nr:bifunctional DNA primase/polymerase [Thermoplasmata archaeon]
MTSCIILAVIAMLAIAAVSAGPFHTVWVPAAAPAGVAGFLGSGDSRTGSDPRTNPTPIGENPPESNKPGGRSATSYLDALSTKGYTLLPLPSRRKEYPPKGWPERHEAYDIPADGNVAIGVRGEVCILITNDDRATDWARAKFGEPNVRSVRGGHWYMRPGADWTNLANTETEVGTMELHVRNKYALVPPSIHPSGTPYTWVRELTPLAELPICPDIRALWRPDDPAPGEVPGHPEEVADEIVRLVAARWRPGIRWMLTKAVAGFARGWLRLDEVGTRALVQRIADSAGDRDQLDREGKIHYTFTLAPERIGVGYWCREAGLADLADSLFGALRRASPPSLPPLWIPVDAKGKPVDDEKHAVGVKPSTAGFVVGLMADVRVITVPGEVRDRMYAYDARAGVHRQDGSSRIRAWVERQHRLRDGRVATKVFVSEVLAGVARRTHRQAAIFDHPGL